MAGDRIHGINLRGLDNVPPRSPSYEGRFGRLFRKLPPAVHDEAFLLDLATRMREEAVSGWNVPDSDGDIPAGYTYLGQFIDHDVTFDPASSLERANDPDALVNFRTPKLDLDSLYGSGPDDDPFLYDRTGTGLKLLVGKGSDDGVPNGDDDLPRNVQGRALLGDPRNDENVIVSQLHLAFVKAHNTMIDEVASLFPTDEQRLQAAQRIVRWRYQWIVVHDYLRRILDPDVYRDLITDNPRDPFKLKHYKAKVRPYLPVEFSVAAFRFGHSMVRPSYVINDVVPELPLFKPGDAGPLEDFRGFRPLPSQWTIRWGRFFDLGDGSAPAMSRKIDTHLADALFTLPGTTGDMQSLAFRNLLRGLRFCLPSGQAVAAKIGATPLTSSQLGFEGDAPLWFYVLKEAEELHGGLHLGPVGSRIVGETLLGLIEIDPQSYVNAEGWPIQFPEPDPDFTMADFLKWAVPAQT